MMIKIAAALAAAGLLAAAAPAAAAVQPAQTSYKTCAAMNKGKYPHGVGKPGATDKVARKSDPRVTNFTRNAAEYKRYSTAKYKGGWRDLDRDNDGIACEKN